MRELRHPLTLATYGVDADTGLVKVTDGERTGLFTPTGEWRSGDVFDVDREMCVWVGGPDPDAGRSKSYKIL